MIPRTVHQIWIDPQEGVNSDPPDDVQRTIAIWRNYHPDFLFHLWKFDELLSTFSSTNASTLDAMKSCRFPAMQADIGRLLLLKVFGGFWVDLKLSPKKPFLNELVVHSGVFFEHHPSPKLSNPQGFIINSFIGAEPEHFAIEYALSTATQNVNNRKTGSVFDITGPIHLTHALAKADARSSFAIISQGIAWNELVEFGPSSYNTNGRHWSERQKNESMYFS